MWGLPLRVAPGDSAAKRDGLVVGRIDQGVRLSQSYAAQHESFPTSLSKVWAASLIPSDRVR